MLPSSPLIQRGLQEGNGVGEAWPTPHLTQQLILFYHVLYSSDEHMLQLLTIYEENLTGPHVDIFLLDI